MRKATLACALTVVAVVAATATAAPRGVVYLTYDNYMPSAKVRPASVQLAGDGTFGLVDTRWSRWGSSEASGRGISKIDDCTPTCAGGHIYSVPATIVVSRPIHTDCGRWVFSRAVVTLTGAPPPFENSRRQAVTLTYSTACQ